MAPWRGRRPRWTAKGLQAQSTAWGALSISAYAFCLPVTRPALKSGTGFLLASGGVVRHDSPLTDTRRLRAARAGTGIEPDTHGAVLF